MIAAQFDSLFTNLKNNNIDNCKDALEQLNFLVEKNLSCNLTIKSLIKVLEENLLKIANEKDSVVLADKEVAKKVTNLILHCLNYRLNHVDEVSALEECTTLSNFAFKICQDSKLLQDNIETAVLYKYLGEINYLRFLNLKSVIGYKEIEQFLEKSIDNFFLSSSVFEKIKINPCAHAQVLIEMLRAHKEQLQSKLLYSQGQYSEFMDEHLGNFKQTIELIELVILESSSISKETVEEINYFKGYRDLLLSMQNEAYLLANKDGFNWNNINSPAIVFSPMLLTTISNFEGHDISPYFDEQQNIDNKNNGVIATVKAKANDDLEIHDILSTKKPKVLLWPTNGCIKLLESVPSEESSMSADSTPVTSRRNSSASSSPRSISPKNF